MAIRFAKKEIVQPKFTSRSSAFDFMFAVSLGKGKDPLDAAKDAELFAEIITKNKSLPDVEEVQKQGVEKYLVYLKQVVSIKQEHPEIWEMASGALGGLIGAFAGSKAADNHREPEPVRESIDFDNLT